MNASSIGRLFTAAWLVPAQLKWYHLQHCSHRTPRLMTVFPNLHDSFSHVAGSSSLPISSLAKRALRCFVVIIWGYRTLFNKFTTTIRLLEIRLPVVFTAIISVFRRSSNISGVPILLQRLLLLCFSWVCEIWKVYVSFTSKSKFKKISMSDKTNPSRFVQSFKLRRYSIKTTNLPG